MHWKVYQIYHIHAGSTLISQCLIVSARKRSLFTGLNEKGIGAAWRYVDYLTKQQFFTETDIKPIPAQPRLIRLYNVAVSAGLGSYLEGDGYDEITSDALIPEGTDYAVKVTGDSMEPVFFDGDVMFVREQPTLESGEIGIFNLNGEAYVKRLEGKMLVSLNAKYKPISVHEYDDLRVLGKVLGRH